MQNFGGEIYGTTYSIKIAENKSYSYLDTQIKAELNRIDFVFSTYKPTSEISLINEDPNRVWSDEFRNLFNLSNEISNLSEGAFSPNDANGFDFSAIGKGYAIDKIAELMEKNGVNNYFIEIGGEISYSKPTNSLNLNSQAFMTQNFFIDAEIDLPWKMTLFTESEYAINTQRAEGYNINFLIINLSIEKRFNKNENLILSIEGNDILNQNIIAQRLIQNNIIIDNITTIISRYFLARLTYRFNNNKTKMQDESFH